MYEITPATESLFVSSAQEMYDLVFGVPRTKIESKHILEMCIPMPCLFGCPLTQSSNSILNLFEHYFRSEPSPTLDTHDQNNNDRRGLEETTPDLIQQLLRVEERDSNTDGFFLEYGNLYPGSNSVVISAVESYE